MLYDLSAYRARRRERARTATTPLTARCLAWLRQNLQLTQARADCATAQGRWGLAAVLQEQAIALQHHITLLEDDLAGRCRSRSGAP